MSSLNDSLHWRYATKIFDSSKKVSEDNLKEILESLRLSPSSFGLQPWKFILVENPKIRARIKEHAWGQTQVTDASHLLVLCARTDLDEEYIKNFVEFTAETRGIDKAHLKQYEDLMIGFGKRLGEEAILEWAKKQVYIASGFLMLAAAEKRIDTCPMEGFDPQKVDEILGLIPKKLRSVLLMPVGYRSNEDKYAHLKKVRFHDKDVFMKV